MSFYEVKAKCGHVGRNNYIIKSFAVTAESAKDAASIVRNMPRVKHHHKDAIRQVIKITASRFHEINKLNSEDPYFLCSCIQEQKLYDIGEVFEEEGSAFGYREREEIKKPIYIGKKLLRKPKKYLRGYLEGIRSAI